MKERPDSLYWLPTPAGAYYAVSSAGKAPARHLLCRLLGHPRTPRIGREDLPRWCGVADASLAEEVALRVESMGWIQGLDAPLHAPDRPMEEILPGLLEPLSDGGRVLLADPQGFYIASSGFPHETAEELAALSADLMSLEKRHHGLLSGNLRLESGAFGILDAGGHSRLGIWPLHIGRHCFTLVMTGIPHFNHPGFVHLVWTLMVRYAPAPVPEP